MSDSLVATSARRLKKDPDNRKMGLAVGIGLQARGYVIRNTHDAFLDAKHTWFGNAPEQADDKQNPREWMFKKFCI